MSEAPTRPRLSKAAFVVGDGSDSLLIPFQWNPETLTRSLTQTGEGQAGRPSSIPQETLSFDLDLDAADSLDQDPSLTRRSGIGTVLAALSRLSGPSVTAIEEADKALAGGKIAVLWPAPPPLYLTWGESFIVPVQITELSITEQDFNSDLLPQRAQVRISLRILSHAELGSQSQAGRSYLRYLADQESLAKHYRRQPKQEDDGLLSASSDVEPAPAALQGDHEAELTRLEKSSRLQGVADAQHVEVGPDGKAQAIVFRTRRFVPPAAESGSPASEQRPTVLSAGDSLHSLAARFYGDSSQYWRLAESDPGRALQPRDLESVGRILRIPKR